MWTALSLALLYGGLFAGYGYWAALQVRAGAPAWPFVLALPVVWLVVPLVVTIVSFALAGWFGSTRPRTARLSPAARLRLFVGEFLAIAAHAPAMLFYRVLTRDPAADASSIPVLLVHGVLCNAGAWHGFMRNCARAGIAPVYAFSYGPPLGSIDVFAEQLATKIDAVLAATGAAKLVLVGHSMGGLVARAYLSRYGGARVARLITLGTPHQGSVHAYLVPGTSLSQLRPNNAWLGALPEPSGEGMPPIVSIWSWHDSMVAPQTSARIGFGRNVELAGVGHNALLSDPAAFARVAEEIRRARDDAATPAQA